MQVLYDEDIASHIGPEPCAVSREGQGEASAGEHAGWPLSRVRPLSRMPTALPCRKATRGAAPTRAVERSGAVRDPSMYGHRVIAATGGLADSCGDPGGCGPVVFTIGGYSMTHYIGLDVSQKLTSICIVDDASRRLWRGQCASDPEQIERAVRRHGGEDARIGIETGPMTPWLVHELRGRRLDVTCLDARHARAALKMQINKTDQNDAEGLAQIMRTGWYRPVHVKSLDSHRARALLGARSRRHDNAIVEPYPRRAQDVWLVARPDAWRAVRSARRGPACRP